MNENNPDQMVSDFHIGENLQLDDFPYVWLMRQVDIALQKRGYDSLYYPSDELPTYDGRVACWRIGCISFGKATSG